MEGARRDRSIAMAAFTSQLIEKLPPFLRERAQAWRRDFHTLAEGLAGRRPSAVLSTQTPFAKRETLPSRDALLAEKRSRFGHGDGEEAPGIVAATRFVAGSAPVHSGFTETEATATAPQRCTLRIGGAPEQVLTVQSGETLLAAGLAAGAAMPYSCAMGGCGTCKGWLKRGEVTMTEPNCLTDEERQAGYILCCVARPLSDVSVEVGCEAVPKDGVG